MDDQIFMIVIASIFGALVVILNMIGKKRSDSLKGRKK